MLPVGNRPRRAARTAGSLPRRLASPHALLVAVSVVYCLLIGWRTSQSMSLQYDEVVYASQVARDAPAAWFTAPRARGTTLLVAPVVVVTEWAFALRAYLTVLAGGLMYLAFRPWLAVFGRVGGRYSYVPTVAAGCFASLWVTVLYGNMAYPNLWLAFALVAGAGYFCRSVAEPRPAWGPVAAVGIAFAAASLIRPTDALAVAGPLLVAPVLVRPWRRIRPLIAVAAGVLVGWAAWVVEAYARFDGPVERLQRGGEINRSGLVSSLPENLDALGGPAVLCRPHDLCAGVEPAAAAWWLLLPVLVAAGLVAAARHRWLAIGTLPTAAAVAAALPYLFLIDYAAPRFLLPSYGLLAIPVAGALVLLTGVRRVELRAVAATLVAGALLLHLGVQLSIVDGAQDRLWRGSEGQVRFADFIREEQDVRPPCLVWGQGAIQAGYLLKCRSIPAYSADATPAAHEREIVEALERGDDVVVRLPAGAEPAAFMAGWRRVEPPGSGDQVAYLPPAGR